MSKIKLLMLSQAASVEGQGVGSAYLELMRLLESYGKDYFELSVNGKTKGSDVIHVHTIDPPGFLKMRFSKKPSVISVHFTPEMVNSSLKLPKLFVKVFDKYIIHVYKTADHYHIVNPNLKDDLIKLGFPEEKIQYIPNFVAKDCFYRMDEDRRMKLREKYGYKKSDFIMFACGQTQQRKGVPDFIRTAMLVPEAKFIWAGGFSFGKITEGYDEIKQMLDNLPENVSFPGIVSREEINDLLNISDLFFFPSFSELFPMSILEAASTHTPLLLRDIPEYKNILTGHFYPANTNEEFAEAIRKIRDDEALRNELTRKAAEVSEKYSEENIYGMWKEFYTSCAAEARK